VLPDDARVLIRDQRHVATNATPRPPRAAPECVVRADCQGVFPSAQLFGYVELKWRVAAAMRAKRFPVQPNFCTFIHCVELQADVLVLPHHRHGERALIPALADVRGIRR